MGGGVETLPTSVVDRPASLRCGQAVQLGGAQAIDCSWALSEDRLVVESDPSWAAVEAADLSGGDLAESRLWTTRAAVSRWRAANLGGVQNR